MSIWRGLLVAGVVLSVAACGDGPAPAGNAESSVSASSLTSEPAAQTTSAAPASTSVEVPAAESLPMCHEVHYPTAPDDWYSDSPVYVGDEMPFDAVRRFAAGLPGYQNMWVDQRHNGWISVGFVDGDVAEYQAALEERFPGVGVVAVDMPYSHDQLDEIRRRIAGALPDDMDVSTYEARGVVRVWVGRLTPERIANVEEVAGDDPVCLEGLDPVRTPEAGPQQPSGDGWVYLGVVDSMAADWPAVLADAGSLDVLLTDLRENRGWDGTLPSFDFETHIVVGFSVVYSGSCPETRFDNIVVDGDLVYPVIPHLSTEYSCTDERNGRTYLVAIERDRLPAPPFRISNYKEAVPEVQVTADLRQPGRSAAEDEIANITLTPPRTATRIPLLIETGYPWTITIDLRCGIEYLGIINGVGWYNDDATEVPAEWAQAAVDGLLDVVILLEEGPEPTLTASAAGQDILYLPGPRTGAPCD